MLLVTALVGRYTHWPLSTRCFAIIYNKLEDEDIGIDGIYPEEMACTFQEVGHSLYLIDKGE